MDAVQRDGGRFLQRKDSISSETSKSNTGSGISSLHTSQWEEVTNMPLLLNKIKQLLREATPEARERRRNRRNQNVEASMNTSSPRDRPTSTTQLGKMVAPTKLEDSVPAVVETHQPTRMMTTPPLHHTTDAAAEAFARAILPTVTQQQQESLRQVQHLIQTLQAQLVTRNLAQQSISNVNNIQATLAAALLNSVNVATTRNTATMLAAQQQVQPQSPSIPCAGNTQHDVMQLLLSVLRSSS
jgi:hypothetical protein